MRLIILGSGGYGQTVEDVAIQLGYDCIFLDDSIEGHLLSSYISFIASNMEFIPAFGNNSFRLKWIEKIESADAKLATLIYSSAYVSSKAMINTTVVIEKGCIINLGEIIDHGCVIEKDCHICLGTIVKGDNRIVALTRIEAGEVIQARQWSVN